MAFREVAVTEIREALRAWLDGAGLRTVAERAGVDRKTAQRYMEAAVSAGLSRDGGESQLTDELLGVVAGVFRPVRPGGHGSAWDALEECRGTGSHPRAARHLPGPHLAQATIHPAMQWPATGTHTRRTPRRGSRQAQRRVTNTLKCSRSE
jgi:hypothetical protein